MVDFAALEPLSTGDIIDRAVRVYRRNFTALLGIVAIPTIIEYIASVLFWYGYSELLMGMQSGAPSAAPMAGLLAALVLYPVWLFTFLTCMAGVSRMVGDYVMLGEGITIRRLLTAIRKRLGDIFVMGLLSIAILAVVSIVFYLAFIVLLLLLVMMIAAIGALGSGSGIPPWVGGVLIVLVSLAAVIGFVILLLVVVSRFIFIPQVVMIEGQSAGSAIGRAFRLGARNWKRVAGIALFSYFVRYSILFALLIPLGIGLYLSGSLTADFFVKPTWTILSSAFTQISALLSTPIWIISLTLLYFDNRVRKEGYDVELLARSVQVDTEQFEPVFAGSGMQAAAFGYPVAASPTGRVFVQTSPLGLAGYGSERPEPQSQRVGAPPAEPARVTEPAILGETKTEELHDVADGSRKCARCQTPLPPGGRFCHVCGLAIPIKVV